MAVVLSVLFFDSAILHRQVALPSSDDTAGPIHSVKQDLCRTLTVGQFPSVLLYLYIKCCICSVLIVTRLHCPIQCDGRCYGNRTTECCNLECAGGCTGGTSYDCLVGIGHGNEIIMNPSCYLKAHMIMRIKVYDQRTEIF